MDEVNAFDDGLRRATTRATQKRDAALLRQSTDDAWDLRGDGGRRVDEKVGGVWETGEKNKDSSMMPGVELGTFFFQP